MCTWRKAEQKEWVNLSCGPALTTTNINLNSERMGMGDEIQLRHTRTLLRGPPNL